MKSKQDMTKEINTLEDFCARAREAGKIEEASNLHGASCALFWVIDEENIISSPSQRGWITGLERRDPSRGDRRSKTEGD